MNFGKITGRVYIYFQNLKNNCHLINYKGVLFMFTVDEYIRTIKSSLEKERDLLIENLKKTFTYKFSSDTDLLEFTPFIEPTRFEVSIRIFSMDKDANEVFNE